MNAEKRIGALRKRMSDEGLPLLVVINPVNLRYLTGFDDVFDLERAHVGLISADRAVLYTDNRYREAAERAAADGAWEVRLPKDDLMTAVSEEAASRGVETIAVEENIAHSTFVKLERAFSGTTATFGPWVEAIRQVKEPGEVARIEAAQEITDRCFEHVLEWLQLGQSERDVALEIEYFMRREGSDGVAFPPIVASGPNSAMPHAIPGARSIQRGDFVKMDFGARFGGYCADMTRTVVMGSASDEQRSIYAAVLAANTAGSSAISAGVIGKDADAAARESLREAGFGEKFTHGLGHGVGLEVHELPGVGPKADKPLPAGAVVTVEPGVYEPGFGGVRIEDLVVVEATGRRVLTRSTKELIEL